MKNEIADNGTWCENVIVVDADFADKVAFDLIVNFERMLERRVPPADMAHWIDCIALDGGLREGGNRTQVVFVHDKKNDRLENFSPAVYDTELNGKAFNDNLGEFLLSSFPVENIVSKEDFFVDVVATVCASADVKRVMIVPDDGQMYDSVRRALSRVSDEKRVTMFAMQPMQGGNFRQEILGYSLMSALGIRSEEFTE